MLSKPQGRSRQQGWLRKAAARLPQSMGTESLPHRRILEQAQSSWRAKRDQGGDSRFGLRQPAAAFIPQPCCGGARLRSTPSLRTTNSQICHALETPGSFTPAGLAQESGSTAAAVHGETGPAKKKAMQEQVLHGLEG
jgi:hypothetical protein